MNLVKKPLIFPQLHFFWNDCVGFSQIFLLLLLFALIWEEQLSNFTLKGNFTMKGTENRCWKIKES